MLERFNALTFTPAQLDKISEYYNKYHRGAIEPIRRDDFLEFSKTGNRINYENKYFARRHRINGAFMMWRARGGEYLGELRKLLFAVCGEETWVLPAHANDRNGVPDPFSTSIDLFAAETGMMLAEIAYLADGALGAELERRINSEIHRRIIEPFEKKAHYWEKADHNWAAVCACGVGIAYMHTEPDRLPLDRLLSTMKTYISGYNDDGICLEGIGYWSYGFGFYLYFAAELLRIYGIDIIHTEKARRIAEFQHNTELYGGAFVTCSDAPAEFSAPEGFLGMLYEFYGIGSPVGVKMPKTDECGRWAHFIRSYLYCPSAISLDTLPAERVFPESQWYINRKERYGFFIKGGSNGEPHNHNDVGSFIIADEGGQLLCDLGMGEYTREYFDDSTRYNYLCNSSLGHSVPVIDGKGQRTGAEYFCDKFECGNNAAHVSFGNAYGADVRVQRHVRLYEDRIILRDSFEFADNAQHGICERFVTRIEPKVTDNAVVIGRLSIKKAGIVTKETIRGHDGAPLDVYIIDIPAESEFLVELVFE